MGEYATRKLDHQSVKIGTCEDMYYLRYEDKSEVVLDDGSDFGMRWRLPLPSEDHIKPGDYKDPYFRGNARVLLHSAVSVGDNGEDEVTYFEPHPEVVKHPGLLQLTHESGLLLNVNCYHGLQLPEPGGDIRSVHWNGKATHNWYLQCLKEVDGGLLPVVACAHCGQMYRESWAAVLPYITDEALKRRLMTYAITFNEV